VTGETVAVMPRKKTKYPTDEFGAFLMHQSSNYFNIYQYMITFG
jgi:hypothetical protein